MEIDKLPYTLTKGVTATREGLWIRDGLPVATPDWFADYRWWPNDATSRIAWPDAAERLQYREGEPWCQLSEFEHLDIGNTHVNIVCFPGNFYTDKPSLHRLAAILCEDADAFRVLLWCVHNLGEN